MNSALAEPRNTGIGRPHLGDNYGKLNVRRMIVSVMDLNCRHDGLGLVVVLPTGLQVAFEMRVASGDLDADAVSWLECVARYQSIQLHPVHLAGFH